MEVINLVLVTLPLSAFASWPTKRACKIMITGPWSSGRKLFQLLLKQSNTHWTKTFGLLSIEAEKSFENKVNNSYCHLMSAATAKSAVCVHRTLQCQ